MVQFVVSVAGATGAQADSIRSEVEAAGAEWARHLAGDATLQIAVTAHALPAEIADGTSDAELGPDGLYHLHSVLDLLGQPQLGPAIRIDVDPARLAGVDPIAVVEHEIGHGLAFDGWSGSGDAADKTTFDALIVNGRFTGAAAEAIYGGPVPMDGLHVASSIPDLMNSAGPASGQSSISPLDLAILHDTGVPTRAAFGTKADDVLAADGMGQEVFTGFGDDTALGHAGADTLHGGAGNDLVRGGRGDDSIAGGPGNDTLYGDLGSDTLSGGPGSDVFVFRAGDGADLITGFETIDRIVLPGPYAAAVVAGDHVDIAYAGGVVTLAQTNCFDAAWVIAT